MLTSAVGVLLSFRIFMTPADALRLLALVGLWLEETFDGFGPGRVLLVLGLECVDGVASTRRTVGMDWRGASAVVEVRCVGQRGCWEGNGWPREESCGLLLTLLQETMIKSDGKIVKRK